MSSVNQIHESYVAQRLKGRIKRHGRRRSLNRSLTEFGYSGVFISGGKSHGFICGRGKNKNMKFDEENSIVAGSSNVDSFWKPEEVNDEVVGRFVESFDKDLGGKQVTTRVLFDDDTELRTGLPSYHVINEAFKEIPLDAVVRVKYLGEVKSEKSGRTYKNFTIEYTENSEE